MTHHYHDPGHPEGWVFHVVLWLMLSLFAMFPLVGHTDLGKAIQAWSFGAIMLGSLLSVRKQRWLLAVGVVLTIPAVLGQVLDSAETLWWESGLTAVAMTFTAVVFLVHVFSHRRVTPSTISGALCVFLLMGLIWTSIYEALWLLEEDAFRGIRDVSEADQSPFQPDELRRADFFYLSFVTLTTLGYGDITPASPAARSFAILEATCGQLFLVVLVARFVGIHAASRVTSDR